MNRFIITSAFLLLSTFSSYAGDIKHTATEIYDWVVLKSFREFNNFVVSCSLIQGLENRSAFIVQYRMEQDVILLSIYKETWNIPDNVQTMFFLYFDNEEPWSLDAFQADSSGLASKLSEVGEDTVNIGLFAHELQTSKRLRIKFDGNEPDWNISLNNSYAAFKAFESCVSEITNSQPFKYTVKEPSATQPFNDSIHRIPFSPVYPRPEG